FDCTTFARWIDAGGADATRVTQAAAHASACAPCAEAWAGERAIVALLRGPGVVAATPPDFAERVMARVALTLQDAAAAMPAPARVPSEMFPWWIRAAAQPASVLALALAGVVTAFTPQLLGASLDAPQWSAAALALLTGTLAPSLGRADALVGSDPLAGAAVSLALLPLVALVSMGLYRLGASMTTARFAPPQAARTGGRRA
ncbi:MAG: hypothetical protein ABIP29_02015, partial [Candidatus Eisenbacteria bacterium]